jgi:hypothetical protein
MKSLVDSVRPPVKATGQGRAEAGLYPQASWLPASQFYLTRGGGCPQLKPFNSVSKTNPDSTVANSLYRKMCMTATSNQFVGSIVLSAISYRNGIKGKGGN